MTVHYGWHAVTRLPDVVRATHANRVLLVCGRQSFEASGASRVLPDLTRAADVLRWHDFRPNPDAADLVRGLAVLRDWRPDLVLGVGGGSALDMAKLLCAFAEVDAADLNRTIRAGTPMVARRQRLVLVPTTSGSGSEATTFAVVYLDQRKHSVAALAADAVVLDPALSVSGSRHLRAAAGLDAVAQAVESLWAVAATGLSRRYARRALGLLVPAIEPFVTAPAEDTARAMAIGSHLAGRAINTSRTTAAHALSYGLTAHHGVSHGHAVALTLGAFIRAHGTARPPTSRAEVHTEAMREVSAAFGTAEPTTAATRFETLVGTLGLPTRLRDVGVHTDQQLADLANDVNAERLSNNPIRFDNAALLDLLRECR